MGQDAFPVIEVILPANHRLCNVQLRTPLIALHHTEARPHKAVPPVAYKNDACVLTKEERPPLMAYVETTHKEGPENCAQKDDGAVQDVFA